MNGIYDVSYVRDVIESYRYFREKNRDDWEEGARLEEEIIRLYLLPYRLPQKLESVIMEHDFTPEDIDTMIREIEYALDAQMAVHA